MYRLFEPAARQELLSCWLMIGKTDDSNLPLTQIVSLKPGAARIAGRVIAGAAGFTAPLSNRPCVYYQIHGRNHRRPWHDHFHYPPQGAHVEVEDESGRILLNLPAPRAGGSTRDVPGIGSFCEVSGRRYPPATPRTGRPPGMLAFLHCLRYQPAA